MSINETYKGQWSSDSSRLQELLDAGCHVFAMHNAGTVAVLYADEDEYWYETNSSKNNLKGRFESWKFLDSSPRLDLPELQWELQNKTFETAKNGEWQYRAGKGGWSVWYNGNRMAFEVCDGIETAKAAIHEWRLNHLKSMIA